MTFPPNPRPRLFTVPFVMVCFVNFALITGLFIYLPLMVGHATREYGASGAGAGFASSGAFVGALVGRLLVGAFTARVKLRPGLVIMLAATVVATLLYPFVDHLYALYAARLIHGLCLGIVTALVGGASMTLVPAQRRGEGAGWYMSSLAVGTGLGPLGALLLADRLGMTAVFWAIAGLTGLALLAGVVVVRALPPDRPLQSVQRPRGLAGVLDPRAISIGVVMMGASIAQAGVVAFVEPISAAGGFGHAAGWYFLVYAAATLLVRVVAGYVQDRHGDDWIVPPVLVLVGVGAAVSGAAGSAGVLLFGAVLVGLGFGVVPSAGQAIAVNRTGVENAALAFATYFIFIELGAAIAPVLMGALVPHLGFSGTFLICGACSLLGVLLWFTIGRRPPRSAPSIHPG